MRRREFLQAGGVAAAGLVASGVNAQTDTAAGGQAHKFKLRYAPHFGMFQALAGKDPVKQLEFAAQQGFRDWEDNTLFRRSPEDQKTIIDAMQRLDIRMGVFVAYGVGSFGKISFTGSNKKLRDEAVEEIRGNIDLAKRARAKWVTVVPGKYNQLLEEGYQTAKCVELLKRCSEVLEPHGIVMVLEPLNWYRNHPGLFLRETHQAFEICQAVGSPSCKILFDIYHQQIQEGNLIPNIDMAWEEIGYFQCGDNPGRNEPGTGEINYRNVFRHIHSKGFEGIMGMEHGNSKPGAEGAQAVIDAYLAADDF